MCDTEDLKRWAENSFSRRQLGALGAGGVLAACTPAGGRLAAPRPSDIQERPVTFSTRDGTADGDFFHREGQRSAAVILYPDIAGIRAAKRQMARRLVEAGYAVLLPNPYYRDVRGQQFEDFAAFAGNDGFARVGPWRQRFTTDTILADVRGAAAWLAQQDSVDTQRGIAVQGYCMTGSFALVAPAVGGAIRAGASFHGGGLVRPAEANSPHRMMAAGKRYLIAIARNDDAKAPDGKDALQAAAAAARATAEIEVYPADHGWCVPDSPSYDAAQAERAWQRLLATYRDVL